MFSTVSLTVFSLIFGAVFLYSRHLWKISRQNSKASSLGCKPIPSISRFEAGVDTTWQIISIIITTGGLLPYFQNLCTQKNTLTFHYKFLNRNVIFTAEPANYRTVFSTDFRSYELPYTRNAALRPVLGESVFNQNGKAWKHSRGLLRPWFAPKYTLDLESTEANLQLMLRQMSRNVESGIEIDLHNSFGGFAVNNTSNFLFGASPAGSWYDICTQDPDRNGNVVDMIDFTIHYSGLRVAAGSAYWLFNNSKYQKACKIVHDFVDIQVANAISGKLQDTGRFTLANALAQEVRDPKALRSHLTTMMQAGTESTSKFIVPVILSSTNLL
jgi:cytochrome P450